MLTKYTKSLCQPNYLLINTEAINPRNMRRITSIQFTNAIIFQKFQKKNIQKF